MIPGDSSLSRRVIGASIEVHGVLGPPLLESSYEECLALELTWRGIPFTRQHSIPVVYKGIRVNGLYRVDFLLQGLVVEVKAVEKILRVHEAQLLTYMRMLNIPAGLLLNFNVPMMRDGIRRLTLR
ncbi:MAG: GxxExxY protein [Gemmatimonadaceae bacterium]|nr:GxxExxY protein [Gemmatimonadaceae bacterium]